MADGGWECGRQTWWARVASWGFEVYLVFLPEEGERDGESGRWQISQVNEGVEVEVDVDVDLDVAVEAVR